MKKAIPQVKRVSLTKSEANGLRDRHDNYLGAQRELLAEVGKLARRKGVKATTITFEGIEPGNTMILTIASV